MTALRPLSRSALLGSSALSPSSSALRLGYPTSTQQLLTLTHRALSTTPHRPVASTSTAKAESKKGEDELHGYQPHPSDLSSGWKSTRPHENWVSQHAVYSPEEVNEVKVVRHKRDTISDHIASGMVKFARWGFDFVTRYKHASPEAAREAMQKAGKASLSVEELQKEGFIMTKDQWMARILFLESIAGVPGMVAAVLRHLRSLRLMKRDGGWISTLLQEAENERMHLLTFMKIGQPSLFFRALVLGAQGVFWNAFFVAYLVHPRAAHRFVGYLEEEAVVTYTNIVEEIKRGNIPEWAPGKQEVPNIAKDYWRLGKDATMLDLVLAVRADEASHRFTNHTLANFKKDDFNPLAMKHAGMDQEGQMPGFTPEESRKWLKEVEEQMTHREIEAKVETSHGEFDGKKP